MGAISAVDRIRLIWQGVVPFLASISIEPVFLLDGFAYSNMVVAVESLQFDKMCSVNLNFTDEICENKSSYPDEERQYNELVATYKRNEGAIQSVIPLFFILFIGAWSDKYGRKVPLCLTLFCHILYSSGYLVNSLWFALPVEFLLFVGFLDSVGGGAVAFLTVSNAYISDVSTKEQRTSKVALANSLWFLGGPLGTLIGTEIIKASGYKAVFSTSFALYIIALAYVLILLPESHGPFCDKKRLRKISKQQPTIKFRDTIIRVYGLSKKKKNTLGQTKSEEEKNKKKISKRKMFLDFFDIKRVIMSFKCVLKPRDGFTRLFILLLILGNFLRKIGRGAYAFHFTKEVLKWGADDYGYFSTYKNFISTMGSLLAVPILSTKMKVSDNSLAMIGSASSVIDYVFYGLVTPATSFFMYVAPAAAILINSCSIAMRAMMSKYVNSDELGQVSAVTGTLEGVVPIISTSLYSAITSATFETYPAAQYFFGAACNLLMALIFVFIMIVDKGGDYDLEKATPKKVKGPVREKSIVVHSDSNWLFDQEKNGKIRLATILLTAFNFSIEVPSIERVYSTKDRKVSCLSTLSEDSESSRKVSTITTLSEESYTTVDPQPVKATDSYRGIINESFEAINEVSTNVVLDKSDAIQEEGEVTEIKQQKDKENKEKKVDSSSDTESTSNEIQKDTTTDSKFVNRDKIPDLTEQQEDNSLATDDKIVESQKEDQEIAPGNSNESQSQDS